MDVLVIGGGAAGLMAAGTAAKKGLKVTLLERNDKLARKVAITGKGRCNVTNNIPGPAAGSRPDANVAGMVARAAINATDVSIIGTNTAFFSRFSCLLR